MSQPEVILLLFLALPVLLILFLRANATMVFLSLCLGAVVTQFLAPDITWFADTFFKSQVGLNSYSLRIGLLLAPALLTTLLLVQSVRGLRAWLNTLPALAIGGLTPLLVVPLLYATEKRAVMALPLWQQLAHAQSLIVGIGALISLFFLWFQRSRKPKDDDKKKSS